MKWIRISSHQEIIRLVLLLVDFLFHRYNVIPLLRIKKKKKMKYIVGITLRWDFITNKTA